MIKDQIGTNAGRIWHFLNENGESNISEIKKALSMKGSEVRMALGWLARENKVFFFTDEDHLRVILLE
ncbi:MAG: winged helix-turn-helix domain-containing protein [Mangrovibacterium sp.]